MLALFIDTNVLLSFYAFSQDDLTRLQGLSEQMHKGDVVVFMTPQLQDEFRRNREAKIHDATKNLRGRRLDLGLPRLCDPYPETERLKELARDYARLHSDVVAKIDRETRDRTLNADKTVERIFSGATLLDTGPDVIARARMRLDCGNPPGKRGSMGDAINWEALLSAKPEHDLYFVTDDGDYYSPLGKPQPHEFLVHEWEVVVGTKIAFVQRLSDLPEVPREVLPLEDARDERDELVERLFDSGNFATTHDVIARLSRFATFTRSQTQRLFEALLSNSQVGWILGDHDALAFYKDLLDRHAEKLEPEQMGRLQSLILAHQDDDASPDRAVAVCA